MTSTRHALKLIALLAPIVGCDPTEPGSDGDGSSSSSSTTTTDASSSSSSSSSGDVTSSSSGGSTTTTSTSATTTTSDSSTTAVSSSTGDCGTLPPGEWVDCNAGEDCGSDDATCATVPQGDGATCLFTPNMGAGCDDVCDCPAAPPTGDAVVMCGDAATGDGTNACYLDCSGGATCPDGQTCFADEVCAFEPPTGGPYEPCNPPDFPCDDDALCVIDGIPPTIGVCAQTLCDTVADCAPGPAGSTVACADFAKFVPGNECYLECAVDDDCPAGATCYLDTLCVYPSPE